MKGSLLSYTAWETELRCVHIVFMCDSLYSDYCRNIQEEIKNDVHGCAYMSVCLCGSPTPPFTLIVNLNEALFNNVEKVNENRSNFSV